MLKKFIIITICAITALLAGCTKNSSGPKTDYTSLVTLQSGYETKSFFNDGIGVVKLSRCVDGDTTHFTDENGKYIEGRFIGIDTPESTGTIEEFGKAAARYTCEKVSKAKEIVLESETSQIETDSNGRYMVYVWADGVLVNLGLVQEGLAVVKGISGTKYSDYFLDADAQAIRLKLNIRSKNKDQDYYYGDGILTSLKELRENPEAYKDKRIAVYGVVTRTLGTNAYIEEYDEETKTTYGMYIFTQYKTYDCLRLGNYLKVVGILSVYDVTNTYQIVDVKYNAYVPGVNDMTIVDTGRTVTPTVKTVAEIGTPSTNKSIEGTFVKLEGLTGVEDSGCYDNYDTGAITARAVDANGNKISIRIDKSASVKGITTYRDFVGKTFDLSGLVSVYDGVYQIMLVSKSDLNFK